MFAMGALLSYEAYSYINYINFMWNVLVTLVPIIDHLNFVCKNLNTYA